jgi:hypothetical protein
MEPVPFVELEAILRESLEFVERHLQTPSLEKK